MRTYLSKDQMAYAENEEEAAVYVGLKLMYDKMLTKGKERVEINFNLKQLYYQLSGNFNLTRYDKPRLEAGINGLINAGVVDLIDTDGKDEYVLDIRNLKVDNSTEAYTIMNREEIRAVFNLHHKNKMNLLRFAIGLFGTFNNDTKCGWCSFRNMPYYTNVPERTCQDYFKVLEENGIIYVCHSKRAKRDKNGQIRTLSNVYGRPKDKEAIDDYCEKRDARQGYDFTRSIDSYKHGVITRRYNKYIKGAFEGDASELIKDCMAYNGLPYQAQHEETQYDLSVFDSDMIEEAKKGIDEHWKQIRDKK